MRSAYQIISVIFLSIVLNISTFANRTDSPFSDISLTTAKELAAVEGKLIYVDFYANWCVPCKWMDETTYADKKVISTLNSKYITVKINIDDFDGYTLKEEYNIKVLPTVLVLDESGRVIQRYEESLSPSKLSDVLEGINLNPKNDNNREMNVSPMSLIDNNNPENNTTVKTTTISYRVQVGVFSDYANTEKMLTKLYENFNEPVVVLTSYLNDKTVYKIYVGDFKTLEEAEILKEEIERKFNMKCFIKSFE